LLIVTFPTLAQERRWEWLNPKMNGNFVNNVSVLQDQKTIVVGYDSNLVVSHDQGVLWSSVPVNYRANKVYCLFLYGEGSEVFVRKLIGQFGSSVQNSLQHV
jgi:photosystem II stability/assembly factor-like uncharacterized protein